MKSILFFTIATAAATVAQSQSQSTTTENSSSNTVLDIVTNSPDHTIFTSYIETAGQGVKDALMGLPPSDRTTGQGWTILAPTDAAFRSNNRHGHANQITKLQSNPNFSHHLLDLLEYHVVGTPLQSTELLPGQNVVMGNDATTFISSTAPILTINTNATVVVHNLQADSRNGYVHVIDHVLLPPSVYLDVYDIIMNNSNRHKHDFSKLVDYFIATDLQETVMMRGGGAPITLFAPTNEAFDAMDDATRKLWESNPSDMLLYHVYEGIYHSSALVDGDIVMMDGTSATITAEYGMIQNAPIRVPDMLANNGIVHVMEAVLRPRFDATTIGVVDTTMSTIDATRESNTDGTVTPGSPSDTSPTTTTTGVCTEELVVEDSNFDVPTGTSTEAVDALAFDNGSSVVDPDLGGLLGLIGGGSGDSSGSQGGVVSKKITIPVLGGEEGNTNTKAADAVSIVFDLYQIDAWAAENGDLFIVTVGETIEVAVGEMDSKSFSETASETSADMIVWNRSVTSQGGNLGFDVNENDKKFLVTMTVPASLLGDEGVLTLGFKVLSNDGNILPVAGVDNLLVTALYTCDSPGISETTQRATDDERKAPSPPPPTDIANPADETAGQAQSTNTAPTDATPLDTDDTETKAPTPSSTADISSATPAATDAFASSSSRTMIGSSMMGLLSVVATAMIL